MGAGPIAILDSRRFGDLDSARVRYLFGGVVAGVGDYGNCVGIPNIGGEVVFDRGYEGNPIVNAMCLGLMKREELITASALGVGAPIMAVGARTGRDGIHGATFASAELSEDADDSSRPRVQVGDPFTEKLLLEASLELIASGAITGIQDMGAAGITSSAAEMAGRGGSGIELEMADVPSREEGMSPYEILLSESQGRMPAVAGGGRGDEGRPMLTNGAAEAGARFAAADSLPQPPGEGPSESRWRGSERCRDHALTPLPALRAVLPPEGGANTDSRFHCQLVDGSPDADHIQLA